MSRRMKGSDIGLPEPVVTPTYAVASDLSEIIETDDGFGKFPTKLDALDYQIALLEGELETTKGYLATARRRRSALRLVEARKAALGR